MADIWPETHIIMISSELKLLLLILWCLQATIQHLDALYLSLVTDMDLPATTSTDLLEGPQYMSWGRIPSLLALLGIPRFNWLNK